MSQPTLKQSLNDAMKAAMRAREKERLGAIRLIQAEVKRIEVDERIEVDDTRLLTILDKMCKQRRDSITQYEEAGREELAAQERAEMAVIQEFMPTPLSDEELDALIEKAIADSGADSMKDMGKVVGLIKPAAQGRADMAAVSRKIKERLAQ
ncbi:MULTISPECIES: GatB/YqeY domain-containing protein [Spongiibacter]|uniref:GatB/YqeY domain-containing protein n=1 Tax=Spongiibacter TaxID=630749 RepID=UPI001B119600|nr:MULTISPECIES: GatB/YqeY domain-containing protein [Spongiibacter]MBO6753508.1 GatB/YqeY domain-containing protein [Spongiibacter sp.]